MPARSRLTHLQAEDFSRTAWKNGLGFTDQIAIHPPGASLKRGDFDWRISTARIEHSAPFSLFPEHDRVLVVLEGGPVTLSHQLTEGEPAETVTLPELEPYEFPGDIPTHCSVAAGGIQDLSVFLRKGVVSVQTRIERIGAGESLEWEPMGQVNFAYCARGGGVAAGPDCLLAAGQALRVDRASVSEAPVPLELRAQDAQAQLVLIEIEVT